MFGYRRWRIERERERKPNQVTSIAPLYTLLLQSTSHQRSRHIGSPPEQKSYLDATLLYLPAGRNIISTYP